MIRRVAVAVGLAAALVAAGGAANAALTAARPDESVGNPIAVRGCVIRYDTLNAAGTAVIPRINEDTYHICVGVTAIGLEANGDLRIENRGGSYRIVAMFTQPDETLVAKGIDCGPSGGGSIVVVRCYNRAGLRVRADSLEMYAPGSNIWFGAFNWTDERVIP
jgi:hypothetical protein